MPASSVALSLRARDFMQTDVLAVSPETSLFDIHRMFVEEEIHGVPVVDRPPARVRTRQTESGPWRVAWHRSVGMS